MKGIDLHKDALDCTAFGLTKNLLKHTETMLNANCVNHS